ncbi:hypothetical protein ACFVT5_22515 [Streptomyces sp. NPDC058001]|uniref:hypothetical protein n=1 Tax=Streptomyces sp. NPDC058001 TaxID=3346300 RepID=UPI0036E95168
MTRQIPAAARALLSTLVVVLLCALGDFGPTGPATATTTPAVTAALAAKAPAAIRSAPASGTSAPAPAPVTAASAPAYLTVTVTHAADDAPCAATCGTPPRVAPDATPGERHTTPGGGALVPPGTVGPGAPRAGHTRRSADIAPYTRPVARPTDRAPPLRTGS